MARAKQKEKRALLLGTDVLTDDVARALASSDVYDKVFTAGPSEAGFSGNHQQLDLFDRGIARALAERLAELSPSVVAVLAASRSPVTPHRHGRYDLAVARAVTSAVKLWKQRGGHPGTLITLSSTAVYGVARSSPLLFDESHPLGGITGIESGSAYGRWVRELREAERAYEALAEEVGCGLLVLRSAAVAGGPISSQITEYLASPLPIRVAGYDPPMQLIHYEDLVRAIVRAIEDRPTGILNLVGRGVTPLSRLGALAGKLLPALPVTLARMLAPETLGTGPLRGRCIADGSRAVRVLGLSPKYSTERTLVD